MTIKIYAGNKQSTTKLFKMPAGEWHVQLSAMRTDTTALVQGATPDDIMALAVWADAMHRAGMVPSLVIPYFPGARQDRAQEGEALSAKVYANMINAMNFKQVTILDPHSIVTPALIDRVVVRSCAEVARWALRAAPLPIKFAGVIAPDVGAAKRAQQVADEFGVPMFQATKERDPGNGKLSKFSINLPIIGGEQVLPLLVVDDIIDGGGTFIGLAEYIHNRWGKDNVPLSIYATHGIFSGSAHLLTNHYTNIVTTDSYQSEYPALGYRYSITEYFGWT
jgi:ribose-phosphate pyrophosphokinase